MTFRFCTGWQIKWGRLSRPLKYLWDLISAGPGDQGVGGLQSWLRELTASFFLLGQNNRRPLKWNREAGYVNGIRWLLHTAKRTFVMHICVGNTFPCAEGDFRKRQEQKKKRKTWDGTKSLFPNISTFQGKVLLGGTELQVFRKRHRFTYTHVHTHTHTHTHSETATHSEQPDQTHPWSRHYHTCSQHARWRTATTKKTPIVLIYGFHVPNLLL